MKKWKKVLLLTLLMGSCFAAGAVASNGIEKVDAFLRPDFKMVVDGKAVQLENPVLLYNDSSYLPVRAVSELLGANVNWQDSTNTIYINPRFAGQPEIPADTTTYPEIKMEQPYPLLLTYLGKDYGLLSFPVQSTTYYRVKDLARMGVDTKGLLKYKESKTGDLYVREEDAKKLYKEMPVIGGSFDPVTSGVYDTALKDSLVVLGKETIPYLGRMKLGGFPMYAYVFFIDAIDEHPGYYFMYFRDEKYTVRVFAVNMEKNTDGKWSQRSIQSIDLDYTPKFFEKK